MPTLYSEILMNQAKLLTVVGTMSGTSFDGIDVALITTDGNKVTSLSNNFSVYYQERLRQNIRRVLSGDYDSKMLLDTEDEITLYHAQAINRLLKESGLDKEQVDLIGFHGQTIFHDSRTYKTWQLGNPSLLAELSGINVIADFRRRDMANGGEGAPLAPLFHAAIFSEATPPLAIINIGGVANITYLGRKNNIIAFDTGPGCALIDDWIYSRMQLKYDADGEVGSIGTVHYEILDSLMEDSYFSRKPSKSLDRNHFTSVFNNISNLNAADGVATLTHFTAKAIAAAKQFLPQNPVKWIISGGGRRNKYLMKILANDYGLDVQNIDEFFFKNTKLNGDFIEAQAFAFLAARSYLHLPLSLPSTTGTVKPVSGGGFYFA